MNLHDYNLQALYEGAYVDAAYGVGDGLKKVFDRVRSLPPEQSDNHSRVERVLSETRARQGILSGRLLDVGAGSGVFPYAMKQRKWECHATDLDPRSADHLRYVAGATPFIGKLQTLTIPHTYNLITFNKVLEHIEDPASDLAVVKPLLADGGIVYIELPDAEAAIKAGAERQEFFLEHFHTFSAPSFTLLCKIAGFRVLKLERVREPSGKFTLFAFADVAE